MLKVVVFTGGRGSEVLSNRLLADSHVDVTLAINGYDDGASTGEVRRFLGDSLGPSDFRKNASRVAVARHTCSAELVHLLNSRLPSGISPEDAATELSRVVDGHPSRLMPAGILAHEHLPLAERLRAFLSAWEASGRDFHFGDCSLGNLVFAGCFLRQHRNFNVALDDYTALLGLASGIVDNVTDGTNAHLVALTSSGGILGTEEAIVTRLHQARIQDLFLIDGPLDEAECRALSALGAAGARQALEARTVEVRMNPRLARKIDDADVIVYAPGTQHSSLYPSYMTPGLNSRIAGNLKAIKLLITNLEADVEIAGENAVTLVQRALHYLTDKGRQPILAPCLVTHYLLNDPGYAASERPLVPLGQVETFEDSRLVRIGNFEDGASGRHDAAKVLEPFLQGRLEGRTEARVAVLLHGDTSPTIVAQTLLEIARSRRGQDAHMGVFLSTHAALTPEFLMSLPFEVRMYDSLAEAEWWLRLAVDAHEFDFVALFDSSGEYRGEDLTGLFQYLSQARLAAVWGSRRLSIRDIREAYRRRHYPSRTSRILSRFGSHVLSGAYLLLYGRYVTDTLSGVRIIRASDVARVPVPLSHPALNQYLLAALMRRRADILEVPVQYLPKNTARGTMSLVAGLASLFTIVAHKIVRLSAVSFPEL